MVELNGMVVRNPECRDGKARQLRQQGLGHGQRRALSLSLPLSCDPRGGAVKEHGKSWPNIFARIVVGSAVALLARLIRL